MPDTTPEAPDLRAFQGSQPAPKHTPGPWKARIQTSKDGRDLGWIIEHPNGRIGWASLAYADTNKEAGADDPAREANARLIAAAPNLLSALAAIVGALEATNECPRLAAIGRAAIDKAAGDRA